MKRTRSFHDGDETLRGVLNAGHRKGGAVLRSVGDDFEPRAFTCYAATVIALIGQLPGTLADRSVDIVLARRRPSEAITPFRLDQTEHLDALARRIARWAKDNGERLGRDPAMPPGLHNRAADNWRPLLAIAEAVGGHWPETARSAAAALAGGDIDEVSRTELLLSDIRDIFAAASDRRDHVGDADRAVVRDHAAAMGRIRQERQADHAEQARQASETVRHWSSADREDRLARLSAGAVR